MFKFLNKRISTPIAITIIVLLTLLVEALMIYQYKLLFEEISTPPVFFSFPSVKTVIVTTDKTEYEQGEIVEITVKNNLDKSIWYVGNLPSEFPWWDFEKLENGIWEEISIVEPLMENGKEECVLILYEQMSIEELITELKTNSRVVDEWDFENCYPDFEEDKFIDSGTYRFSFIYSPDREIFLEGRYDELKTIYSNEFTIK